jgi:sensor histidine kinase YesM
MKKRISIRSRMFLSFSTLIVAALVLVSSAINKAASDMILQNAIRASRRELTLIRNILDANIGSISDYVVSVSLDERVIDTMRDCPTMPTGLAASEVIRNLNRAVGAVVVRNRNIVAWDFLTMDHCFLGAGGNELKTQPLDEEYYANVGQSDACQLMGPFPLRIGQKGYQQPQPTFVVSKSVLDLNTMETYGYATFFVQETMLSSSFQGSAMGGTQYCILSPEGRILSSSATVERPSEERYFEALPHDDYITLLAVGSIVAGSGGDKMLYMAESYGKLEWTIVAMVPMHILLWEQGTIDRTIFISALATCMLSFLCSFFLAHSLSRPVLRLAGYMDDMSMDNMDPVPSFGSSREIAALYDGYNGLLQKVNSLLIDVYREEEEKSKFQFMLLQSQIKPHFLYNTLETIKSLVDLDLNGTASLAISAAASFYRISLNKGNDILTVADEIELSKQYMYIQQLRYVEYLAYEFSVEAGVGRYLIPKLTLQPILENAIYHGIKEKQEKGRIRVHISTTQETLVFRVWDDGVGMDAVKLDRLRNELGQTDSEQNRSFGLASVNHRIRLLYGESYGISVDSQTGAYTEICLVLPKREMGK